MLQYDFHYLSHVFQSSGLKQNLPTHTAQESHQTKLAESQYAQLNQVYQFVI